MTARERAADGGGRAWRAGAARVALAALAACGDSGGGSGGGAPDPSPYVFDLPAGFPTPVVPAENPMSEAKVELGRRLFHDVRLSRNGTQSCASCHRQELAFTDGLVRAVGSTGEPHPRNTPSIANVAYAAALTWANPLLTTLEDQALVPLFAQHPVELGFAGAEDELLARFAGDAGMAARFAAAFPDADPPVTLANVVRALGAFQRTVLSGGSPFDRYAYGGEPDAISDSAKRGLDLFLSERLECDHCHGGALFQGPIRHAGNPDEPPLFANDGLYDLDGAGAYPAHDQGLFSVTTDPRDVGRFRPPSLRNVARTAPYMHDGSIATLDGVIDHYVRGGRLLTEGPYAGDGARSPLKSPFVGGFRLEPGERADLLAFLATLTDEALLADPRFGPPEDP